MRIVTGDIFVEDSSAATVHVSLLVMLAGLVVLGGLLLHDNVARQRGPGSPWCRRLPARAHDGG
ncbi:MAG: hypothetical protein JNN21_13650 [Candidatus Accumulibacter sp.]|uniref:hypothetical protein n=1 Tax=Accumulibacter sp. TaxID=2053492 RepID=UPI001A5329FA|nr:hypothetical protein [Accumulibacter sp.]MBL8392896.1 hypothetical protein [Accumulibacter sp.]HRD90293.1 hypothetical protein [Accumulibacter sp.]